MLVPEPALGKRRLERLHSTVMERIARRRRASDQTVVGVIADTHGLLRPEAVAALASVDLIVHAGDIGSAALLDELARIAPVLAVRGNNDRGPWARAIAETQVVDAGGVLIYIIHDVAQLDLDPAAGGFGVVIAGHSHVPRNELKGGVLWFNPGSAGPRRFKLPISVGKILIDGARVTGRLETLEIAT